MRIWQGSHDPLTEFRGVWNTCLLMSGFISDMWKNRSILLFKNGRTFVTGQDLVNDTLQRLDEIWKATTLMANSNVIYAVTEKLKDILTNSFQADDALSQLVSEGDIVFENPGEANDKDATKLSLWLYQVTENEFSKNQRDDYGNGNRLKKPPLALNLYYLVTPFGKDPLTNQLLMGRTLQTFHDNASITLINPEKQVAEELRIVFCRLSLEELTRIWEALREAYRLSVCYQVRVIEIDSERTETTARVIRRTGGFGNTPESEGS